MSIVRQFLQTAFSQGYAQTMLAAIRDRANLQEQIRMLESHKRQPTPYVPHDTRGDSDGDDGA